MLTLVLLQDNSTGIPRVAGVCPGTQGYTDYLNEAIRRLMDYGNWYGSVVKMKVCIYGACVTWPRNVGTVIATNICRVPRPVMALPFEFMPLNGGDISGKGNNLIFNWGWGGGGTGRSDIVVENDGNVPALQPPCNSAFYVRFYNRAAADAGQQITIYGVDSNGQELYTTTGGVFTKGQTITLGGAFASSSTTIRKITQVVKPVTQGYVDAYYYDPVNNVLNDMAHYAPDETNPWYEHSTIKNFAWACGCNPQQNNSTTSPPARSLLAYVKLKHIKMSQPNDVSAIDCIAAIKLMVQSIKMEEAYNEEQSQALQASSIKELNRHLRNKIPLEQVPVTVESFGTAVPARHGIGRIL